MDIFYIIKHNFTNEKTAPPIMRGFLVRPPPIIHFHSNELNINNFCIEHLSEIEFTAKINVVYADFIKLRAEIRRSISGFRDLK